MPKTLKLMSLDAHMAESKGRIPTVTGCYGICGLLTSLLSCVRAFAHMWRALLSVTQTGDVLLSNDALCLLCDGHMHTANAAGAVQCVSAGPFSFFSSFHLKTHN